MNKLHVGNDTERAARSDRRWFVADGRTWQAFAFLLAPLIVVAALYWPTTLSYVRSWNDYDNLGNTHGWLILAIVIWLLYLLFG
jgi:hypothetical protein